MELTKKITEEVLTFPQFLNAIKDRNIILLNLPVFVLPPLDFDDQQKKKCFILNNENKQQQQQNFQYLVTFNGYNKKTKENRNN